MARYLNVSRRQVHEFARQHRLDRYVVVGYGHAVKDGSRTMWTNARGAKRIIEHYRAMQGRMWDRGRDWDVEHGKRVEARRVRTAREKAERVRQQALAALALLAPAQPCAGVQLAPTEAVPVVGDGYGERREGT